MLIYRLYHPFFQVVTGTRTLSLFITDANIDTTNESSK